MTGDDVTVMMECVNIANIGKKYWYKSSRIQYSKEDENLQNHYKANTWLNTMHIRPCPSVQECHLHIRMTPTHTHLCWVKLFTVLTKPMHCKYDTSVCLSVQCVYVGTCLSVQECRVHFGRVPYSLFKTAWFCWMCQHSNMQGVVVWWWWSSTSDWLRSTECPVVNTCSARADAWVSPFLLHYTVYSSASTILY